MCNSFRPARRFRGKGELPLPLIGISMGRLLIPYPVSTKYRVTRQAAKESRCHFGVYEFLKDISRMNIRLYRTLSGAADFSTYFPMGGRRR